MDSPPSPSRSEASSSTNGSSEHRRYRYPSIYPSIKEMVFRAVKSGYWEVVLNIYEANGENIQMASITSSKEKVLHIAISHNRSDVSKALLELVADGMVKEMKNDRDNNPLHLAASLGKADMCEVMMDKEPELIECRNKDGETPLFLAALHGRKEAFYTLRQKWIDIKMQDVSIQHCKRNDGNSILHVTILGEYFDLAFQIIKWYPELAMFTNERGQSPLHILALHPSVFRSGCYLGPLENFIYRCLLVEELEDEWGQSSSWITASKKETAPIIPGNYVTCFNALKILGKGLRAVFGLALWRLHWFKRHADIETPQSTKSLFESMAEAEDKNGSFPPNYNTCCCLLELVLQLLLVICGSGFYKLTTLKEKKRRHVHSTQLMKELVKAAGSWEAENNGSRPSEDSLNNLKGRRIDVYKDFPRTPETEDEINGQKSAMMKSSTDPNHGGSGDEKIEQGKKHVNQMDKKKSTESDDEGMAGSALLVAAKMGLVEMVEEVLNNVPMALYDEDSDNKNVFMLAAENGQTHIVDLLRKMYPDQDNIYRKVDNKGNTAIHLAATFGPNRPWRVSSAAIQMQWDLKWYNFIKSFVPTNLWTVRNIEGNTSMEVFEKTHEDTVKHGVAWLNSTSQSCSMVAALIASVAYASATAVPGGDNQYTGIPILKGRPAFDTFAIASLVALCFSLTSLTMFLSVITSSYMIKDFLYNLPTKLLLGFTSLFISTGAMLVSFCAGHSFNLGDQNRNTGLPIFAIICMPVSAYFLTQFHLLISLVKTPF